MIRKKLAIKMKKKVSDFILRIRKATIITIKDFA